MGRKSRQKKEREKERASSKDRPVHARLPWWLLALVAALAFLSFVRTIPYEFVYDDEQQILRNPWLRDWSSLKEVFTTDVWRFSTTAKVTNYYRPLHMVLYMVGYRISGLKPHGFHILNILLHCACSILVVLIGYRLTGEGFLSAAGGLIFAVHPVHAESIAWIAAVTDPLCAFFYFGALYFYIKHVQVDEGRSALGLSLACYFCALLSKEMAFTFPLIAAWLDWSLYRKLRWSRYGMCVALFAVYAVLRIGALTRFFVDQVPLELDTYPRVLSTIVLIAEYTVKIFVPYGLNASHVFNPTTSIGSVKFLLSLIALVAFAAAAWAMRRQPQALFLSGYCIITLVPLMNISGLGESVSADRYLYIPSLGACLLIPLAARHIWALKVLRPRLSALTVAGASLACLLAIFGWMLWKTTFLWQDSRTLYTETLRRSPGSVLFANNLARYYFYKGDHDRAEEWYTRARELWDKSFIKSKSRLSEALSGLGGVYYQRGRLEKSLDFFKKAYEVTPRDVSVLQNLGAVYVGLEDYTTALTYYQRALEENPRSEVTYNNLSAIYLTARKYDEAIAHAQKALEIFPRYGDAFINLGRAYAAKGMKGEARRAFLSAREADPSKSSVVQADLQALEMNAH